LPPRRRRRRDGIGGGRQQQRLIRCLLDQRMAEDVSTVSRRAVPRPAEPAISLRSDHAISRHARRYFLTRPELLRPSIARRRWIGVIWRWWWIDRRQLQAV
jgi:hypothetical protein